MKKIGQTYYDDRENMFVMSAHPKLDNPCDKEKLFDCLQGNISFQLAFKQSHTSVLLGNIR